MLKLATYHTSSGVVGYNIQVSNLKAMLLNLYDATSNLFSCWEIFYLRGNVTFLLGCAPCWAASCRYRSLVSISFRTSMICSVVEGCPVESLAYALQCFLWLFKKRCVYWVCHWEVSMIILPFTFMFMINYKLSIFSTVNCC